MNAMVKPATELQQARPTSDSTALMRMIETAMSRDDFDVDKLKELLAVKKEWEANEARKAYVAAMASFKAEKIEIAKDKKVGYENKDGTFTGYKHASIGNVVGVVCEALGRHGFSHRWDTKQEGGLITVTCVITHELGHAESTALSGKPDESGKKNAIQQTASTISYLQRYTLLAATGLATTDQEDNDGGDTGGEEKSTEELEAERAAAAMRQEWLDAINGCADATELARLKAELVKSCAGADMVPTDLRKACVDKAHQLKSVTK
jgi:hypothetical protein